MNPYLLLNISIAVLLVPIIILSAYLFRHLGDENGDTGALRRILFVVSVANILNWLARAGVAYFAGTGVSLPSILMYTIMGNIILAVANWWALYKVKKLIFS